MIDVHHHFIPQRLLDEIERHVPAEVAVARDGAAVTLSRARDGLFYIRMDPAVWCDPARQLRDMDAAGVEHAILSIACQQDWMTLAAARLCNDGTAEVVSRHPDRFSGMISVPPDGGAAMVAEIERARGLGLCALNITTSYHDKYPDHADFRLLFATAARLDLAVFVHPSWYPPSIAHLEAWHLDITLGKIWDLTVAVARLIYAGVLAEHPGLRLVFAHLGGALPMTATRLFFEPFGWLTGPDLPYRELLRRVFVDTAPGIWQSPAEIAFACQVLGAAQVMLGSDYPISNDPAGILRLAADHIRGLALGDSDMALIAHANAHRCFGLEHIGG